MSDTEPPLRGPTLASERALAPDLARGFMLLLIALANTPWYLWALEPGSAGVHPPEGSVLDRITQFVIITAVDSRTYPMFAFLFGYGMVQLLNRQLAAGRPESTGLALLRRRNLWLLAFGFVHAALLWMGDVLGAYGLAGLVLAWLFLRRRDLTLLLWSAVGTGVLVVLAVLGFVGAVLAPDPAAAEGNTDFLTWATGNIGDSDPLSAAVGRLLFWPFLVLFQGLLLLVTPIAILLGFWAARRRVLEEPERHLPLLRRVAVTGIAAGWLSGLPYALYQVGVLDLPESAGWVFSAVQGPTGLACGVGYVALFGLIGHWLKGRGEPGTASVAITAVGKRSLSCYLAQSVLCAPLLAAWGLGLGAQLHSASMAAFAVGVWLVTVAGAYALERAGRRGPAEVLLRRLAYRQPVRSRQAPASGS